MTEQVALILYSRQFAFPSMICMFCAYYSWLNEMFLKRYWHNIFRLWFSSKLLLAMSVEKFLMKKKTESENLVILFLSLKLVALTKTRWELHPASYCLLVFSFYPLTFDLSKLFTTFNIEHDYFF
jgi:hypothetical protein